ncbi:hypothetical protein M758_10G037100 [Ceratodon purpureus]|nr:hypothetical protein M758_10G037100 [Ceratodon purpureus]
MASTEGPEVVALAPQPAAMTSDERVRKFKKNLYPSWEIQIGSPEERLITKIAEFLDRTTVVQGMLGDFKREFETPEYAALGGGTPLHWAVRMEDVEMVDRILKAGEVDVNAQDKWWKATALHWAVRIGNMFIVDAMVAANQESWVLENAEDRWGYSVLDCALLSGVSVNILMLTALLKFRRLILVKYLERNRSVWREVEQILNGDASTESVQSQLDRKRESWSGSKWGGTWLHWAVIMGDKALALHILAAGDVDADAQDERGWTALQCAFWLGNEDMAKSIGLLVDVNKVDHRGNSFLHSAVRCAYKERTDMVKELLERPDIRLAEESKDGKTPLQYAHENGFKDIQKILMEKEVVRRYVEDLYRDRQVYVDAANAILVGAALIASVTFASWLQPPLGYGSLGYADVQHNRELRAFWIFNCLSFYFAIATVVFGARSVLPRNSYFIKRSVEKLRKNLLVTSILLACSVFFVIIAFGIAGCIVLNPIFTFRLYMIVPTIFGGLVCMVSIALLGKSILEDSFGKKKKFYSFL